MGRRKAQMEKAADFYAIADRVLEQECPSCQMIAGEFAHTTDATFHDYLDHYMSRLHEHVKAGKARRPKIWSCHPYSDIDDPKNSGHDETAAMIRHLGEEWKTPDLWLGESGTRLQYDDVSGSAAAQERGARRFLQLARADGKKNAWDPKNQIRRILWWDFRDDGAWYGPDDACPGGATPRRHSHNGWDSGLFEPLVFGGNPRPAFCTLMGYAQSRCTGETRYYCCDGTMSCLRRR